MMATVLTLIKATKNCREILNIQIGQCRNVIENRFWQTLIAQHNIDGITAAYLDKMSVYMSSA